jgi:hypothetical protein
MWADVLTKPLQGQKFRDMSAVLQNCSRGCDDLEQEEDEQGRAHQLMNNHVKTNASLQECVKERQKLETYRKANHEPTAQLA